MKILKSVYATNHIYIDYDEKLPDEEILNEKRKVLNELE